MSMERKKTPEEQFYLSNTETGRREKFSPRLPGKVTFYSCGPTVYGPLHIGNARQLIFADWIFRWLNHLGYEVNFVRNYTDVDDKIIDRARTENTTSDAIAQTYIDYCETDIRALGLLPPTKTVRVTETIQEIISMIEKIISNGHAYVVEGEVLFSIDSFPGYGRLSGKNTEDLIAGARVEVNSKKRNPLDFSLWKPWKKNNPAEPHWISPWGEGRPGWHIECSAMASRWLGETIDLHHGGQDLIFPHHENEIAQSESSSGKPFCKHWIHHAFLTFGNEKMSKSLGNIFSIRQFNETFGPELLKYLYLRFHFRSQVPFTRETLTQTLMELERVYLAKKWAENAASDQDLKINNISWKPLLGRAVEVFQLMEGELLSDFSTPGALGHLFGFIREINRVETENANVQCADRSVVAREFLELLNANIGRLWNVFLENSDATLVVINHWRSKVRELFEGSANATLTAQEIESFILQRKQARLEKNFTRADEIRKELEQQGIILVDTPSGTTWKNK